MRPLLLHRALLYLHDALLVSIRAGTDGRRPALVPGCRLVRDGDRYLLENGGTVVTLEGGAARTLLPRLLPLLDGTRTLDDLAAELGPIAPAIEQAVAVLEANRLLTDGVVAGMPDSVTAAATFAAAVTRRTSEASAAAAIGTAHVVVLGSGDGAAEASRQLEQLGIGRVEVAEIDAEHPDGVFVLAAPAPHETSALPAFNERALERGTAWLQVVPFDGRVVVAGPLFLPGITACHRCYLLRRGACSGYEEDFDVLERETLRVSSPAALTAIAVGLAALTALRWITTSDPTLPGSLYAVELHSIVRLSHARLLRVPRCPACGPHSRGVPSPWFDA